jgi:hypothetical protein
MQISVTKHCSMELDVRIIVNPILLLPLRRVMPRRKQFLETGLKNWKI